MGSQILRSIASIEESNPELYSADLRSLAAKLKFLQSRGVTSFQLSEILQKSPENIDFNMKGMRTTRLYYHIISKVENLAPSSLPKSAKHKHENIMRNVWALKELGMSQKLLLSLVKSHNNLVFGKRKRFEETVEKVVGKGLAPTTPKFVQALKVIYRSSDQTTEEKVNLYRSLGFAVEDVWYIFKKFPRILALSEKNILNSTETFTGLGFSRDEFTMMVRRHPSCLACSAESVKKKTEFLVKEMKWPLSGLHPKIFSYSMDERIVPRCKVVKDLMSKGLIGSELPSVFSVSVCTNEGFLNRYVRNLDDKELVAELMAIFTARGEEEA